MVVRSNVSARVCSALVTPGSPPRSIGLLGSYGLGSALVVGGAVTVTFVAGAGLRRAAAPVEGELEHAAPTTTSAAMTTTRVPTQTAYDALPDPVPGPTGTFAQ